MREITKQFVQELYALHDNLARAIIAVAAARLYGGDVNRELNQADLLAGQIETKFAEVLTPEERGEEQILPE